MRWTFLLTDIEGSVPLWEHGADAMQQALIRHDALVAELVTLYDGTVVHQHGEGDSRFVVFTRAAEAVAAACDLQRAFQRETWSTASPLSVRMALHTGEAIERDGHYYGSVVNRCARLRGLAHGGQVLLSEATAVLVHGTVPQEAGLRDLSEHPLRGFEQPERVFQLVHPELRSEFAALAGTQHAPTNLPAPATPLLGRDDDVRRIRARLEHDDVRLVTLTGPGGVGKTRLALQVAADLRDDFPDGVFVVYLASISDPSLVAAAIGQALGLRESGGRRVEDAVRAYLKEKRLLLILDNFEQILTAAPLVAELLAACPGLVVLVTSRAALNLRGERELAVSPLAYPGPEPRSAEVTAHYAAVALFVQRAADVREHFTLDDATAPFIAEICRKVDGLPLGIELAAAWIRLFTPRTLVARLERRLPLLVGGARDLPERQRTLRSTIAWSYDLLDEAERWLFRQLSVFAGGFTCEAAEAVCASDRASGISVLDVLTTLVAQSLVRRCESAHDEPRFEMLETIREFALEQLDSTGEAAQVRRNHARYFLAMAERAEPMLRGAEQGAWLQRLDAEHDNMRAALRYIVEEDDAETGLRLGGALAQFWNVRGHLAEGRARLEEVLHLSGAHAYAASRAKVLCELGFLAVDQGDYAGAQAISEESLSIARALGDRRGEASALCSLAWVANNLCEFPTGRRLHGESLAIMRELGDGQGIAVALNGLGFNASIERDFVTARVYHQESLAIMRALGNRRNIARSLIHLGWVGIDQHDPTRAREHLTEGLMIARELADPRMIIDGLEIVAYLALGVGRADRAARLQGAAETLRETIGLPLSPSERLFYDDDVAAVRAALGDAAFAAAWSEGKAMAVEQAIAYALEAVGSA